MLAVGQTYGFPDTKVPREKKNTPDYGRQVAQAIYSRWYNSPVAAYGGFYNTGYANMSFFLMLRQYAEGRQDPSQYRLQYRGGTGTKAQGGNKQQGLQSESGVKGYNNISWDIESNIPVYISSIKGLLSQSDWKVKVDSSSKSDIKKKSKMKWKRYAEAKVGNPLKQELGLPITQRDWFPQSQGELELYERYHGFRLPLETGFSKIAEHGFDISNWTSLRTQYLDSVLQTSYLVGKVCHNREGAVAIEYIDPANFVTSYYDQTRHAEPVFAGYLTKVQIGDIADKLKKEGATDSDLEMLARRYATYNVVGDPAGYNYSSRDPVTNRFLWYDFQVDVLKFEWKTDDPKYYVERESKDGKIVYQKSDRIKGDYSDGRKRKTDTYYDQVIYEGTWLIATQWIIDYGLQKNMMKTADGGVALSFFFERIPAKSIVERWKPLADQQMMATLKLRAAINAAAPKGFMMDIGLLANMSFGGSKVSEAEIIRIARETGIQFYNTSAQMAALGRNGATAITPTEGGIGKQLEEWILLLRHTDAQMRSIAGLSDAAIAMPNASPEKGLGVGQQEIDSTNNALSSIKEAMVRFKEKAARKIIQKARILIEADKKSKAYYENYLGEPFFSSIVENDDLTLNQLGITMVANPTTAEISEIMGLVAENLKAGKNGMIGITTADALLISSTVRDGNLELAAWYLSLAEERARVKNEEAQMRMSQMNAQNQMQAAQASEQMKAQTQQILSQLRQTEEGAKIAAQLEADLVRKDVEHQYTMEELALEGSIQASTGREVKGRI
jgi:hypothetical protein